MSPISSSWVSRTSSDSRRSPCSGALCLSSWVTAGYLAAVSDAHAFEEVFLREEDGVADCGETRVRLGLEPQACARAMKFTYALRSICPGNSRSSSLGTNLWFEMPCLNRAYSNRVAEAEGVAVVYGEDSSPDLADQLAERVHEHECWVSRSNTWARFLCGRRS